MKNTDKSSHFHVVIKTDKNNRRLRASGTVPGNIFGLNKPSISIQFNPSSFQKLYENAGESSLVYLEVEGTKKPYPVLIDEVQHHPVTGEIVHVAFRRVDLTEKIEADVSIIFEGEANVKDATVVMVKDSITVEALPEDLPESFVIDVSSLTEIGQSIMVSDLQYDSEKITLILGEDESAEEVPLVIVQELREEVEPEVSDVVTESEDASETASEASTPENEV